MKLLMNLIKKSEMYNKRTWLNANLSDGTSSVVAFDGWVTYKGKPVGERFLEIADCRYKIRLHQTSDDTKNDFIIKMRLLRDNIIEFIEHLEINNPQGGGTE